jgi:hypothetical protein
MAAASPCLEVSGGGGDLGEAAGFHNGGRSGNFDDDQRLAGDLAKQPVVIC